MNFKGNSLLKYHVSCNERRLYGLSYGNNRVCRFCKKGLPEVSFANKAHAISKALGNKHVFCIDECNNCNKFFSDKIEQHLIWFYDSELLFYGKKEHKIKNRFLSAYRNDNGVEILIKDNSLADVLFLRNFIPTLKLKHAQKFIPECVYKILCKFAICFLDNNDLELVDNTISWIQGEINLPLNNYWAQVLSFDIKPQLYPQLKIFLIKTDCYPDKQAMIGEFFFMRTFWKFRIPLLKNDLPMSVIDTTQTYKLNGQDITKQLASNRIIDLSSKTPQPLISTLQMY